MQIAKMVMKLRIENAAIENPPASGPIFGRTQHTVKQTKDDSLSWV
jgi:hypothetical protein